MRDLDLVSNPDRGSVGFYREVDGRAPIFGTFFVLRLLSYKPVDFVEWNSNKNWNTDPVGCLELPRELL